VNVALTIGIAVIVLVFAIGLVLWLGYRNVTSDVREK
jgi:hypothetical protein